LHRRPFTTSPRHLSSPFVSGPAPPRLPKEEQEIFDRLQQQSTGAFSTPREEGAAVTKTEDAGKEEAAGARMERMDIRSRINQSPDSTPSPISSSTPPSPSTASPPTSKPIKAGDEFHPNMRRGAPPEFEGEVNPKTGEVGGPKNEPLRWGAQADWSYNGRVTDF
ncbi:DUF1674-domain-containing protein, partial [Amniculicola lignicola CBS 123094]